MEKEDWYDFQTAHDCHICGKNLVKENFWDSLPVYTKGLVSEKVKYQGQYHKKCFYQARKNKMEEFDQMDELGCFAEDDDDYETIILKKPETKADKQRSKRTNQLLFMQKATAT